MGYVRTRQGKPGKSYQAHWIDDQGREQVRTFTRKTDASDRVKLEEAAKIKGESVDTSSKLPVTQYARQWAATRPHRSTTSVRVKSLIPMCISTAHS